MEEDFKKIGHRIKLMRTRHGMPQKEFARLLGIKQPTICLIERGGAHATLKLLFKIHELFGCSMRDFFDDEKPLENDISLKEIVEAMRLLKKLKLAEAGEIAKAKEN